MRSPVGEAMYRFLLAHAQTPPKLLLHIHGEHTEERTRQVQRTDKHGRTRWHTESERHTVVDFNFHIDISRHVAPVPTPFTIPDSEPAYRGKMYQEVDVFGAEGAYANADIELSAEQRLRRKARRQERKTAEAWDHERAARGLPPWVGPETDMSVVHPVDALVHHTNVLKSSKTVREWADEYCASQKMLKEFTYQKVRKVLHENAQKILSAFTGRVWVELRRFAVRHRRGHPFYILQRRLHRQVRPPLQ